METFTRKKQVRKLIKRIAKKHSFKMKHYPELPDKYRWPIYKDYGDHLQHVGYLNSLEFGDTFITLKLTIHNQTTDIVRIRNEVEGLRNDLHWLFGSNNHGDLNA